MMAPLRSRVAATQCTFTASRNTNLTTLVKICRTVEIYRGKGCSVTYFGAV